MTQHLPNQALANKQNFTSKLSNISEGRQNQSEEMNGRQGKRTTWGRKAVMST